MSATPSPTQLFLADSLPVEEAPAVCQTDLENDQFQNGWWWLAKRALLALITFSTGVAVAVAWQSYGDAARETIAPAASLNAISVDLHAVRQSVDRVTTIATSQEQITRSVDQLAASQEQMTREITKLQAIQQDILDRISTPPPRPAPTPKPVLRSQAPIVLTPAKNP
jgi:hypothetical protein